MTLNTLKTGVATVALAGATFLPQGADAQTDNTRTTRDALGINVSTNPSRLEIGLIGGIGPFFGTVKGPWPNGGVPYMTNGLYARFYPFNNALHFVLSGGQIRQDAYYDPQVRNPNPHDPYGRGSKSNGFQAEVSAGVSAAGDLGRGTPLVVSATLGGGYMQGTGNVSGDANMDIVNAQLGENTTATSYTNTYVHGNISAEKQFGPLVVGVYAKGRIAPSQGPNNPLLHGVLPDNPNLPNAKTNGIFGAFETGIKVGVPLGGRNNNRQVTMPGSRRTNQITDRERAEAAQIRQEKAQLEKQLTEIRNNPEKAQEVLQSNDLFTANLAVYNSIATAYARLTSSTPTQEQKSQYETNRQSAIDNLKSVLINATITLTVQERVALQTLLKDLEVKTIN